MHRVGGEDKKKGSGVTCERGYKRDCGIVLGRVAFLEASSSILLGTEIDSHPLDRSQEIFFCHDTILFNYSHKTENGILVLFPLDWTYTKIHVVLKLTLAREGDRPRIWP